MVNKLTYPAKENAVQEKINEIIDNLGGGYSAGTGIDISNDTISVDNTVAMKTDIPAPVTETTVSGWGFTKNTGTVTSVNNIQPDANGNVTITIPDEQVEWATYGTTTFQQVCDWNTAGKVVFVKRTTNSNEVYIYRLVYVSARDCTFNQVEGSSKAISYVWVSSSDYWSYNFYFVQRAIPSGTAGQVVTYTGVQGEVGSASLATVATSGSYNDLSNKPTIPTVNNATLTITQGGTEKGTFTANASSNVTIDLDSGGGSSRNIGEIVASTIPLTDAGLHLLDGALINGSGSYADFVTYIAGLVSTYPDLFTTEANWQSAVTTYGVCGKFVYDSTNQTVRLPKYNSKIYTGGGSAKVYGDGRGLQISAVSSNETRVYQLATSNPAYVNQYSVLAISNSSTSQVGDASKSSQNAPTQSKIIGLATKSQIGDNCSSYTDLSNITTALDGYWYIVIATSTKTQIEVDIDEVMTDLNGKADVDLSNCTKPHIVDTYENGTSWYRVYSDGWVEQGGQYVITSAAPFTINLLKQMNNNEYNILLTSGVPNTGDASVQSYVRTDYTTATSFTVYKGYTTNVGIFYWKVCGYIS